MASATLTEVLLGVFFTSRNTSQHRNRGDSMFRRYLAPQTIGLLKGSRLWMNLVADAELQPEIRDDSVTVYYRGGALLRNLKVLDGSLVADVHPKFVPMPSIETRTYVRLTGTADQGLAFVDSLAPLCIGAAESSVLAAYKDVMDQVLHSFPEGQVVQAICARPESQIVDQEIAFQETDDSRDKIDLCHFDDGLGKLVFVEVKRVEDRRLVCPELGPETIDQLHAYCDRLRCNRDAILALYRQVVGWKRELGLGDRLSKVPLGGPADLLDKPVLVIGNCSRSDVRAIKEGVPKWAPMMNRLKEVAAGLILCGDDGCCLNLVKGRQTLVFD